MNKFYKDKNIYANRYRDTSKRFRGFWHLMFQWRGNVLKLIFHDYLAFIIVYMTINSVYRFYLYERAKECGKREDCYAELGRQWFELFCVHCGRFKDMIPVAFLTGFYVSEVVKRYWDQFMSLPVPDMLALKLVSFVPGNDEFTRNLRLTVIRYINLSSILAFRLVSKKVFRRFPSYQSLVEANLLLPHEVRCLRYADNRTPHESTWIPILWSLRQLETSRSEGKIRIGDPVWASLITSFEYIENNNRRVLNHGWVNFPIAYAQVATLSVYAYFFYSIFGAQYLIPQEGVLDTKTFPNITTTAKAFFATTDPMNLHTPYLYFPFFSSFEFIGYMGWIKVAETLLNPFGDDDEDFQINYLIDRNFHVSCMIVDGGDIETRMSKDPFIEAGIEVPVNLPYQDDEQHEESYKRVIRMGNSSALFKRHFQAMTRPKKRTFRDNGGPSSGKRCYNMAIRRIHTKSHKILGTKLGNTKRYEKEISSTNDASIFTI